MADIVPRFEDLAPAFAQTFMIQTEHARDEAAICSGQEWRECALTRWYRGFLRREQCVSVALATPHFERFVIVLKDCADSHVGTGVEKVERRVAMDAEEQIFDGQERGGFPSLVQPEHDVEVRLTIRQRQIE